MTMMVCSFCVFWYLLDDLHGIFLLTKSTYANKSVSAHQYIMVWWWMWCLKFFIECMFGLQKKKIQQVRAYLSICYSEYICYSSWWICVWNVWWTSCPCKYKYFYTFIHSYTLWFDFVNFKKYYGVSISIMVLPKRKPRNDTTTCQLTLLVLDDNSDLLCYLGCKPSSHANKSVFTYQYILQFDVALKNTMESIFGFQKNKPASEPNCGLWMVFARWSLISEVRYCIICLENHLILIMQIKKFYTHQ